jgi:hypothetical protein
MKGFKIYLLFSVLMIYGCHKDHQISRSTGDQAVDVYVYGAVWHLDASGLYPKNGNAVYYKNGAQVILNLPADATSAGGLSYAYALAVSGDTVYTGGAYADELLFPINIAHALYWVDGTAHILPVPDAPVPVIGGIAANGKNNYELFWGENSTGTALVNGIAVNGVIKYNYNDVLNGLLVSGPDLYVFGTAATGNSAIYYKNNQPVQFIAQTNANGSSITGMFISGQDVYACGYLNFGSSVACYWKNGKLTILAPTNASARTTGIVVKGSDVYVAGYMETGSLIPGTNSPLHAAVLWKNGVLMQLSTPGYDSYTSNVVSAGNDIYVGGHSGPDSAFTVYWKNGLPVKFKIAPKDTLLASGITVVPKNK